MKLRLTVLLSITLVLICNSFNYVLAETQNHVFIELDESKSEKCLIEPMNYQTKIKVRHDRFKLKFTSDEDIKLKHYVTKQDQVYDISGLLADESLVRSDCTILNLLMSENLLLEYMSLDEEADELTNILFDMLDQGVSEDEIEKVSEAIDLIKEEMTNLINDDLIYSLAFINDKDEVFTYEYSSAYNGILVGLDDNIIKLDFTNYPKYDLLIEELKQVYEDSKVYVNNKAKYEVLSYENLYREFLLANKTLADPYTYSMDEIINQTNKLKLALDNIVLAQVDIPKEDKENLPADYPDQNVNVDEKGKFDPVEPIVKEKNGNNLVEKEVSKQIEPKTPETSIEVNSITWILIILLSLGLIRLSNRIID
ncbi:MAG: hypothetical protein GX074_02575 [Erysipelothrix sp.]|nr:hypothetical protein [Erysipelothrix sp.]